MRELKEYKINRTFITEARVPGNDHSKIKVPAFIIITIVAVIILNETDQDTLQARIQFRFKKAIKGCSIVSVYSQISKAEKETKEPLYGDDDQNERCISSVGT